MHIAGVERVLAKSQLLALPDANAKLVCLEGELWLTRDGDSEDYILGPGRSFTVRRGDRAAVQALKPSRVRLVAPETGTLSPAGRSP
jgi:quercetin dioxygenase-like cupin family protein